MTTDNSDKNKVMIATPSQDDQRWQAVIARDAVTDHTFYYAVTTTRIYCKPSCPSRRPHREHVLFFNLPDEAEQAGFRPCQRCNPRATLSSALEAVHRVRHLIESLEEEPTLAELGTMVGFTPTYLQRLFKQTFGISPKQYARVHRLERLKKNLKSQASVTDALYEAGYESSNSLYHSSSSQLGMRPVAYREGATNIVITYTLLDSPLGRLLIAATERGICAVRFGEDDSLIAELHAEYPSALVRRDDHLLDPQAQMILTHLAGHQAELNLPIDVQATAFQARVWTVLRSIPYGETRSYAQVAEAMGVPKAVRAVARACATNPVALIVPCHRVVRSNGELSGYRWGVERKRILLDHERNAHVQAH